MTWSSPGLAVTVAVPVSRELGDDTIMKSTGAGVDRGSSPPLSGTVKGALDSCWGQGAAQGEVTTLADIKEQVNHEASFMLSIIALQS